MIIIFTYQNTTEKLLFRSLIVLQMQVHDCGGLQMVRKNKRELVKVVVVLIAYHCTSHQEILLHS